MTRSRSPGPSVLLVLALACGCADTNGGGDPHPAPPGGTSAFEGERLAASRLVDIRADPKITWTFDPERFEVSCDGGLPADITRPLLGEERPASRIGGRWRVGAARGDDTHSALLLDVTGADGTVARSVELPLEAAGAVRCNLGERQYNVFESGARR